MFDSLKSLDWQIIFTGGLFVVAAFGNRISAFIFKPKLDFELIVASPDCHKVGVAVDGHIRFFAYYFRIKAKNKGNRTAEIVEVFIDNLLKLDGHFYRKVDSFLPMNLKWSHTQETFVQKISRKMYRHCDFFHIYDPRPDLIPLYKKSIYLEYLKEMENGVGIISFDVIVQSFNKGYLVEPGKYRVRLTVAGSNASPKSKTYEIDYQREWSKNEEEMLKDHIKIFER